MSNVKEVGDKVPTHQITRIVTTVSQFRITDSPENTFENGVIFQKTVKNTSEFLKSLKFCTQGLFFCAKAYCRPAFLGQVVCESTVFSEERSKMASFVKAQLKIFPNLKKI